MSMTSQSQQYFYSSYRLQRTALTIVFLYALLNGSRFNILNGLTQLLIWMPSNLEGFWMLIGYLVIGCMFVAIAIFMARRWALARANTNLTLLSAKTLLVVVVEVIIVLIAGRLIANAHYFTWDQYLQLAQWLWQIPLGFFVGTGLSWAVVDRKIAGISTVQPVPASHDHNINGVDDRTEHHNIHDQDPARQ